MLHNLLDWTEFLAQQHDVILKVTSTVQAIKNNILNTNIIYESNMNDMLKCYVMEKTNCLNKAKRVVKNWFF